MDREGDVIEKPDLSNVLANFDMGAVVKSIFRPRYRLDPAVLEKASVKAGEMTGVRPVRPIEDVLAEM